MSRLLANPRVQLVFRLLLGAMFVYASLDKIAHPAAFAKAVEAGRQGFEAGLMEPRDMGAPSTPVAGTPFFKIDRVS